MNRKRVVLVTGATSGIGLAVVERFARGGFRVWAGYRSRGKISALKVLKDEGLDVSPVRLDVDRPEDVRRALGVILRSDPMIDVLVNNAGIVVAGFWEDQSDRDLKAQVETNFFSMARMCRAVLPSMRRNGSGTIVNIGSVSADLVLPVLGPYSASKAAVGALTESLRFECKPYGIWVTEVDPGETKTGIMSSMRKASLALSPHSPHNAYSLAFENLARPRLHSGVPPKRVAEVVWKARPGEQDVCDDEAEDQTQSQENDDCGRCENDKFQRTPSPAGPVISGSVTPPRGQTRRLLVMCWFIGHCATSFLLVRNEG